MTEGKRQELKGMALLTRAHPLHDLLGLTIEPTADDSVRIRLPMRDCLCGQEGILSGGIISCMIDIVGGAITSWHQIKGIKDQPMEEQAKTLSTIRTIDLRIDYLRPGAGKDFFINGSILREGKRVLVIRMDFRNEQDILIAAGIGTYLVA